MGSMNRDPPPYSPEEEGSVHKWMIAVELILIVSEVKLHYPNEGFLTNGVGADRMEVSPAHDPAIRRRWGNTEGVRKTVGIPSFQPFSLPF